jgi:DNA-binding MarR family transcriptional regulator
MEKKVLDAMEKAGKPVRPGEVANMIGEEIKAVSKIISSLKKKGRVVSPKRCYYIPSDV